MKHISLLAGFGLLCSCSSSVMKRAHVIPIYNEQILLSAKPEFIGAGRSLYDDSSYKRPKNWSYEQLDDGSTIVKWTTKPNAREKLVLIDSGFHPIVVPPDAIVTVDDPDETRNPTVIEIIGTNSAFVPDHVKLVPYNP